MELYLTAPEIRRKLIKDRVVDGDLQARSGAHIRKPHRASSDGLEDRLHPRAQIIRTGGENDELALLGRLLGAEHGSVDEGQAMA